MRRNAPLLSPSLRILLKADLRSAISVGRLASLAPARPLRWEFRRRLARTLRREAPWDGRPIVISRESFCGMIRRPAGYGGFDVAAMHAADIDAVLREVYGSAADTTFLYTTRDPESWLRSAWRHLINHGKISIPFDAFEAAVGGPPDFDAVVADVAEAVPQASVVSIALEELSVSRLGPISAVLDLLDVPEDLLRRLKPIRHRNAGLSEEAARARVKGRRSGSASA